MYDKFNMKLPIEKLYYDLDDCFSAMIKHIKQFGGKFECQDNPANKNPKFGWIHKRTNKWFLISSKDFWNSLNKMQSPVSTLYRRAVYTQEGKLALVSAINGVGLR